MTLRGSLSKMFIQYIQSFLCSEAKIDSRGFAKWQDLSLTLELHGLTQWNFEAQQAGRRKPSSLLARGAVGAPIWCHTMRFYR